MRCCINKTVSISSDPFALFGSRQSLHYCGWRIVDDLCWWSFGVRD